MKSWFESKLIWVGLITLFFGVAQMLGFSIELSPGLMESILGAIVVILRLVTKKEIKFSEK